MSKTKKTQKGKTTTKKEAPKKETPKKNVPAKKASTSVSPVSTFKAIDRETYQAIDRNIYFTGYSYRTRVTVDGVRRSRNFSTPRSAKKFRTEVRNGVR